MASFKDQFGISWELALCGPSIDSVRSVDPLFLLDDDNREVSTMDRLEGDPSLFCCVVYMLCKDQREARKVDDDHFYKKVLGDGDAIQSAGEALAAAVVNFTRPKKREFIKALNAKREAVEDLAMARVIQRIDDPQMIDKLMANLDRMVDKALSGKRPIRRSSATDLQAS